MLVHLNNYLFTIHPLSLIPIGYTTANTPAHVPQYSPHKTVSKTCKSASARLSIVAPCKKGKILQFLLPPPVSRAMLVLQSSRSYYGNGVKTDRPPSGLALGLRCNADRGGRRRHHCSIYRRILNCIILSMTCVICCLCGSLPRQSRRDSLASVLSGNNDWTSASSLLQRPKA